MTPLARLHVAQQRQKAQHVAIVEQIVGVLLDEVRDCNDVVKCTIAMLEIQYEGDPNALVDKLAGIAYRARVPGYNSSEGDIFISEPMNGVPVPRLQHGYKMHPRAWVRVIE